jgi:hypothetical protein
VVQCPRWVRSSLQMIFLLQRSMVLSWKCLCFMKFMFIAFQTQKINLKSLVSYKNFISLSYPHFLHTYQCGILCLSDLFAPFSLTLAVSGLGLVLYPQLITAHELEEYSTCLRVVEVRLEPHETHTFMGPLDKCGLSGGKIFYCELQRSVNFWKNAELINARQNSAIQYLVE